MPRTPLSYTAMTGKPVVNDVVLSAIVSGSNLTVFANIGSFKEHHLRVLVTMPRTPLYVIRMVAREPGTNPAKAIDYCSSAAMARALIKICRDVSRFALYEQDCFRVGGKRLHEFRRGGDRFRRREVVYQVLCERVLFGGDVLPPHVSKWFNSCGGYWHEKYMEGYGSAHMKKCYDIYEKQALRATHEVITPMPYQFMVAYHSYTKYLPLTMCFCAVFKKKAQMEAVVKDRLREGLSVEQAHASLDVEVDQSLRGLKNSAEGKKQRRKLARAVKSAAVHDLWVLSHRILGLECCEKVILSFL
ncbi:unnamed protein product [Ectocarpus sp. 6 AP-2014]